MKTLEELVEEGLEKLNKEAEKALEEERQLQTLLMAEWTKRFNCILVQLPHCVWGYLKTKTNMELCFPSDTDTFYLEIPKCRPIYMVFQDNWVIEGFYVEYSIYTDDIAVALAKARTQ